MGRCPRQAASTQLHHLEDQATTASLCSQEAGRTPGGGSAWGAAKGHPVQGQGGNQGTGPKVACTHVI